MDSTLLGFEYPKITHKDLSDTKRALSQVKNGTKSKFIEKMFGCDNCPYRGTDICPHGIKNGEKHANGICSFRIMQLKELMAATGSKVSLYQRDHIVKAHLILEKMREEYAETGYLPDNYHQLERNYISLIDKFRKQTEGLKFAGEVHHVHDDIRNIIDLQKKTVQDAEVIKQSPKDGSKKGPGKNKQIQN